jgi:predicted acyltransferase
MVNRERESSIDTLRGLAIIGMVLSGTIVHSTNIAGWMYHVQVGPPDFKFHPEVAGISWVDLVFPFFLFTMGLAFPFALNSLLDREDVNYRSLANKLIFRVFNLFLFAIMIPHLSPFGLSEKIGSLRWLFAILGFVAFMLTFTKFSKTFRYQKYINILGYVMLFVLVLIRYMVLDASFSIHKNDIIILVLANMALIGSGVWIVTRKNWWARIGILALFLSIWLTANISGSINAALFHFTLLKFVGNNIPSLHAWLLQYGLDTSKTIFYSMYFMKYLLIVIPGTIIGDLMYAMFKSNQPIVTAHKKYWATILSVIMFSFIIISLVGFYTRQTQPTLLITLGLMFVVFFLLKNKIIEIPKNAHLWLTWSFFWLVLGLLLEPYEGGIKKDPATLSYFFTTSGLAGLMLFSLKLAFGNCKFKSIFNFLPMVGKNPMVGYVTVNFLIIPLIGLLGFIDVFEKFSHLNGFTNIFRGLFLTSLMIMITVLTVKLKLFWKT